MQVGQVAHELPFGMRFLHLVFTQLPYARFVGEADAGGIHCLADGQQAHGGCVAACALACLDNAAIDGGEIRSEIRHGQGLRVGRVRKPGRVFVLRGQDGIPKIPS
ncbi:hypothetical protein D3C85_1234780 [compost metagenome]